MRQPCLHRDAGVAADLSGRSGRRNVREIANDLFNLLPSTSENDLDKHFVAATVEHRAPGPAGSSCGSPVERDQRTTPLKTRRCSRPGYMGNFGCLLRFMTGAAAPPR